MTLCARPRCTAYACKAPNARHLRLLGGLAMGTIYARRPGQALGRLVGGLRTTWEVHAEFTAWQSTMSRKPTSAALASEENSMTAVLGTRPVGCTAHLSVPD